MSQNRQSLELASNKGEEFLIICENPENF